MLPDTGPALFGVGIACDGTLDASAQCAAQTGDSTVCHTYQGKQYCAPAQAFYTVSADTGAVRWRHGDASLGVTAQPQLFAANGVVYTFAGGADGIGGGILTARRERDGGVLWQRHLDIFASQMAVAGDSLLVFSSIPRDGTNQLTALRLSDGTITRSTLLTLGSRLLVRDGVIYGCDQRTNITALRASDASPLWNTGPGWDNRLYMDDLCFLQLADGVLYVQRGMSDTLYALRASDGKVLWSATSPNQTVLAAGDGLALVGGYHGQQVAALRASDGSVAWTIAGGPDCCKGEAPPTLIVGGTILLGRVNELLALRASDGHVLWRYSESGHALQLITATSDRAYAQSYLPPGSRTSPDAYKSDHLIALSASDGTLRWTANVSNSYLRTTADMD